MPELVNHNGPLNIVEIQSFGAVSCEDLYQALNTSSSIIQKHKAHGILIDASRQTALPDIQQFRKFIQECPSSLAIAVVTCDHGCTRDQQHMGEFFAQVSGKTYKLFYERDSAVRWLSTFAMEPSY